jgi:hypothetical protein
VATQTYSVELPEEVAALIGSPEAVAAKLKEALVLQFLREAEITQGQAANFLGITRWDILDLMAQHHIISISGSETPEEVREEIAILERLVQDKVRSGDR